MASINSSSSSSDNDDDSSSDDEQQNQKLPVSLSARLKLRLHAKGLPQVGIVKRLPDCWCVVSLVADKSALNLRRSLDGSSPPLKVLGETEIIQESCNPLWTQALWLDYEYGSKLYFQVKVLRHSNQHGQKTIGSALFEVSDILGSNRTKVKRFPNGGVIMAQLRAVPANETKEDAVFRFRLRSTHLELPKGLLRSKKMDTIIELSRMRVSKVSGGSWVVMYRSSPVMGSKLPSWDEAEVNLDPYNQEELMWPIRFLVWDRRRRTFIGSVETTFHNLMDALMENDESNEPSEHDLVLLKGGREVGKLRVIKADIVTSKQIEEEEESDRLANESAPEEAPTVLRLSYVAKNPSTQVTFEQYVESGCEIDFCVGVDFTSSNGDPRSTESLHHIFDGESHNDYQEVIQEVGTSLLQYSSNKECSIWGFGAKFDGEVRHLFQCGSHPTVTGIEGLQQAYRSIFATGLVMSGPTVYDNVIQAAALRSRPNHKRGGCDMKYTVLLIVTDGASVDYREAKRRLSVYSDLPLSVIFIGVGRADFTRMYDLVNFHGARKNATFLEFRKFQEDHTMLAKVALENIPSQIVEYMVENSIQPTAAGT